MIDRIVGYGIAWHEGQLFGLANQLIGTITALALVTLSITGFLSWRRRKPPLLARLDGAGIRVIATLFLLALPMFAMSVAFLWVLDKVVLPRLPVLGRWLGVRDAAQC